jgi:glycogen phosphorylase
MNNIPSSNLPRRLQGLDELAYNLWWSWNIEARQLFKSLDAPLWKATGHNPVKLLQRIDAHRLVVAAQDPQFLKKYDSVMENFKEAINNSDTWFSKQYPDLRKQVTAYFSLEFAIHSSLPLYAGGLGVLAGDFCKESSDLGLPLVAVGFMYPQGYFHQHISADGWQEQIYEQLNFNEAPISRVLNPDGQPLTIEVPLDTRSMHIGVWQVNAGRVKLYLLDTNVEGNSPPDRELSARLYAGDQEMRLEQQIIIGIGGVRVLRALNIDPVIWHLNEGYTAFTALERIREYMSQGLSFNDALDKVRATTVFTLHTTLAGVGDTYSADLTDKYFHRYRDSLGLTREAFLQLGAQGTDSSTFNMTALGLRTADRRNGVSQLHGSLCRKACNYIWPEIEEKDVPIDSVTNGIHVPSWVSPQAANLYQKYLAGDWLELHDDPLLWQKVMDIPDEQIWTVHQWLKTKLISTVKERARERWAEGQIAPEQALAMGALLDTDVLTIAFCRRFTAYKRASLILTDIGRLKRLLRDELRPVQIIFAGKAHPNDEGGKHIIQEIFNAAKNPEFGGRIAFVEDYDMHMARYLVHGADVWLNTPQPYHEASGTSGQKAALNGVPHLSVLDGWWHEGYNGKNGWAIHSNAEIDSAERDRADAEELYRLLEEKIVPLYYDRDLNGLPHGWIGMVKETIRTNAPMFSARRMVKEYAQQMYLQTAQVTG